VTLAELNSSVARPAVSKSDLNSENLEQIDHPGLRAWPLQDSPYLEGLLEPSSVGDLDSSPGRKVKGLTETHDKSSRPVAGSARSEDPSTSREVKGLSENHDESSDSPATSAKSEEGLLFRFMEWCTSPGPKVYHLPSDSSEVKPAWI
jgi:hypothetical protein